MLKILTDTSKLLYTQFSVRIAEKQDEKIQIKEEEGKTNELTLIKKSVRLKIKFKTLILN